MSSTKKLDLSETPGVVDVNKTPASAYLTTADRLQDTASALLNVVSKPTGIAATLQISELEMQPISKVLDTRLKSLQDASSLRMIPKGKGKELLHVEFSSDSEASTYAAIETFSIPEPIEPAGKESKIAVHIPIDAATNLKPCRQVVVDLRKTEDGQRQHLQQLLSVADDIKPAADGKSATVIFSTQPICGTSADALLTETVHAAVRANSTAISATDKRHTVGR